MPLDVTAGPSLASAGTGPPGPAAGLTDAGAAPQGAGTTLPFAALLAQQAPPAQPVPAVLPKSTAKLTTTVPEKEDTTDRSKEDDTTTDTPPATTNGPLDATTLINWTALAALQAPPPTPMPLTRDTPGSDAQTTKDEVMDTAPVSASAALPAQAQTTGSGLLPLPTDTSLPKTAQANTQATVTQPSAAADMSADPLKASTQPSPLLAATASDAAPSLSDTANASGQPTAFASLSLPDSSVTGSLPLPVAASPSTVPAVRTDQTAASSQPATPVPASTLITSQPLPISIAQKLTTTQSLQAAAPTIPIKGATIAATPVISKRLLPSAPRPTITASPAASTPAVGFSSAVTAAVPAVSETPVTAVSAVSGDAGNQAENSAPETLQNHQAPANNTSMTPSSGEETLPALKTTAPAGETGGGQPVTVAVPSKTSLFSREHVGQQSSFSTSSRLKGDDKTEETDPSPSSTHSTEGSADNGANAAPLAGLTPNNPTATNDAATGTTTRSLTGAERAQVIRQMADGVATVKPHVMAHGQGQMTLDLHPKEWGDLRVTIRLAQKQAADGTSQTVVTAHVVASSPAVKAALETDTTELNRALHETGLRLDRLTVTVQAANAADQSGSMAGGGQQSFSHQSSDQSADQWQTSQTQTGVGNSGIGGGGSSSFAAFSERQGGSAFQNQTMSRSTYRDGNESEMGLAPVTYRSSGGSAGFDQRA